MSISKTFKSSAAKLISTAFQAYVINVNECKTWFDVIIPFSVPILYRGVITNTGNSLRDTIYRHVRLHKDIANVYRQYL